MLGLAMTIFIASPAFAGDMLMGEPYYSGLYIGEPLAIDINPDPFDAGPTIRASFSNSASSFHRLTEIEEKTESGLQSSYFETKLSQFKTSGSVNPTNNGTEFNEYIVESEYSRASEFVISGYSRNISGSVETFGASFTFQNSLSIDF